MSDETDPVQEAAEREAQREGRAEVGPLAGEGQRPAKPRNGSPAEPTPDEEGGPQPNASRASPGR